MIVGHGSICYYKNNQGKAWPIDLPSDIRLSFGPIIKEEWAARVSMGRWTCSHKYIEVNNL